MNRRRFHPRAYWRILRRQRARCADCGDTLRRARYEFDHKVALALGGEDKPDNLRAICAGPDTNECHRRKTKRDKAAIAKFIRIRAQAGLLKPKLNRKAKVLAKLQGARA